VNVIIAALVTTVGGGVVWAPSLMFISGLEPGGAIPTSLAIKRQVSVQFPRPLCFPVVSIFGRPITRSMR
jgi:hypothetical protein